MNFYPDPKTSISEISLDESFFNHTMKDVTFCLTRIVDGKTEIVKNITIKYPKGGYIPVLSKALATPLIEVEQEYQRMLAYREINRLHID